MTNTPLLFNIGDWVDTPAFGVPLSARFYVDYLTGEVINYTGDVSQVTIIVPADFIDYYNTTYTNYVVFGYSNKDFLSDVVQSQTNAIVSAINNSNSSFANSITNSINSSTSFVTNSIDSSTNQITTTINSVVDPDTTNLQDISIPTYSITFPGFLSAVDGLTYLITDTLFDYDYSENYICDFDLGFLGHLNLESNKLWFISHHWVYQTILNGLVAILVFRFCLHMKHRAESGQIHKLDSDINITDAL